MLDTSFIYTGANTLIIGNVVSGIVFVIMSWKMSIISSPISKNTISPTPSTLFNYFLFMYGGILCLYVVTPIIKSDRLNLILLALVCISAISMIIYVLVKSKNYNSFIDIDIPEDIENEINRRLSIEDRLIAKNNQLEWAERTAKICYANWQIQTDEMQFSDGAAKIFGITTRNDISFEELNKHIIPEDRIKVQRVIDEINNHGIFEPFLFRIIANGKLKYIQVNGEVISKKDNKAQLLRGTFQDVTEQQMFIKRIEDKNDTLREIAQTQSHDVRGPLATIMGLANLLEDTQFKDKHAKEVIAGIKATSDELDLIIRKIIKKSESIDVDLS